MTNKDFFDRLLLKYKSENPYDIEDLKRYLDINYHNEDFEALYDQIVFNYKYRSMPSVKFVKDLLEESGAGMARSETPYDETMRHNRTITDGWKAWPLKSIIARLIIINKKDDWNGTDREFWGMFGELYYELDHMKEKEYSKEGMSQHLGGGLDAIRKGQGFDSIIAKEQYVPGNVFDKSMKREINYPRDNK